MKTAGPLNQISPRGVGFPFSSISALVYYISGRSASLNSKLAYNKQDFTVTPPTWPVAESYVDVIKAAAVFSVCP